MRLVSMLLAVFLAALAGSASAQDKPAQKGVLDPTPPLRRCLFVCSQGVENGAQGGLLLVSSVAYGAMLGAGIDALRTGRTTIYRKPGEANRQAGSGMRGPSVLFRVRL